MTARRPKRGGHIKDGGTSLVERMRAANPAGAALLDQHRAKADLAMALRAMRKTKQMSRTELRRAAEELDRPLTLSMIERLESPTATLPNLESLVRYAAACGAQVELLFLFKTADDRHTLKVSMS
ncbi:helix-turn-helix domain-containing protein [Paracoccus rhizosphaerae]|uniref:Helix-turn-helix domain-containing protein n=1 Tax=Paracoccus rhizosphaerae TaxID=1133347 RepID=A0ABV6CHY2_9RHOB|nr:helix-turn-helix domain-containing protein [Paracoccus rhizosphaerae]